MTDTNQAVLKPCPGETARCNPLPSSYEIDHKIGLSLHRVECICGWRGPERESESAAIEAWNTRPETPQHPAAGERETALRAVLTDFVAGMESHRQQSEPVAFALSSWLQYSILPRARAALSPIPMKGKETGEARLEFRPDSDGKFDEIVARFADGMVHVETLSKTGCYVGFYWNDGRICQWWINSKKPLEYFHEDGQGDPPLSAALTKEPQP